MIISLIFNLAFFVLVCQQIVTKQRCLLGHDWSKWTKWCGWFSGPLTKENYWKQERVCKRCYKSDSREIGRHRCSDDEGKCTHREQYLSLIDEATNIKALEKELGL
jgi:hypothetical protein